MATRKALARNLAAQTTDPQLVVLQKARQALEEAQTLTEVKSIRDQAEAARTYAKNAMLGLSFQNYAAELKLRAERKAGEFLTQLRPGRRSEKWSHDATIKLEDLGVNKSQSSRWQRQARVPEDVFENYLRQMDEQGREITASGLLRVAGSRSNKKRKHAAPKRRRKKMFREADPHVHGAQAIEDEDKPEEMLEELAQHHALLANVLGSKSSSQVPVLKPADWRAVRQILWEMGELIHQFRDAK